MDMAQDLGPAVFEDQSNAIQNRTDQCETLRSVKIPALILCGKVDCLCPLARHELMHELIAGLYLEIIPDAAHLPTLEQSEQTNRTMKKWQTL